MVSNLMLTIHLTAGSLQQRRCSSSGIVIDVTVNVVAVAAAAAVVAVADADAVCLPSTVCQVPSY